MATVAELIQQYQTDKAMQKEVADTLADGKITMARWSQTFFKRKISASPRSPQEACSYP